MKSLETFAKVNGLEIIPIRYRHQFGYLKRKGFDLVLKQVVKTTSGDCKPVVLSLEPCDYSNGDKWIVKYGDEIEYTGKLTLKYLNSLKLKGQKTHFIRV